MVLSVLFFCVDCVEEVFVFACVVTCRSGEGGVEGRLRLID